MESVIDQRSGIYDRSRVSFVIRLTNLVVEAKHAGRRLVIEHVFLRAVGRI